MMDGTAGAKYVSGVVKSNCTDLYYELRGSGPALLFIAGAGGDAGSFQAVAERLANEYTVVTYDRRGHSRSARAGDRAPTSVEEQADDAGGLLDELHMPPALVFGTSSGALIALCVGLRHPELVSGVLAHEPPKITVLPSREAVRSDLRATIAPAVAGGNYRAAMAKLMEWLGGSEAGVALDPKLWDRILENGENWARGELGHLDTYDPAESSLMPLQLPAVVMVGVEGGTPYHKELLGAYQAALQDYADRLGAQFRIVGGAHTPYHDQPKRFAEELRIAIRNLRSSTPARVER